VRRAGVRHLVLDRGRGGWSAMVLKKLVSDCWSQLALSQGFHPRVGAAYWYSGGCCCCGWPGQEVGRCVEVRCGHEGLRMLLSSGHGAGVHSNVPLPRVVVGRPRCVGPAVLTSGGGGLARRATTASAAIAVLAVVAAVITAIAVFVVVLVLVATGVAVFAIG
jgi:hypothetical protein